jgi:hypothetical protein
VLETPFGPRNRRGCYAALARDTWADTPRGQLMLTMFERTPIRARIGQSAQVPGRDARHRWRRGNQWCRIKTQ